MKILFIKLRVAVFPSSSGHWKYLQPSSTTATRGRAMVDESTLDNLSKNLLKWDKQIIITPQSQNPPSNGWSMVIIKDYQESSIVFPPAHHENLQLKPSIFIEEIQKPVCESESFTPSLSSSSSLTTVSTLSAENEDDSSSIPFSSMGCDEMVGLALSPKQIARPPAGVMDWVYFGLDMLIGKVKRVSRSFPSLYKAVFTAAMVLGYLYFRQRRRKVVRKESRGRFNRIIREKDEKISQLLNQIARMNEVMLALPGNSTIKN